MTVFINGIGVVGGFGCGLQSLEQAVIKQNIYNQETGAFGLNDTGVASSPQAADTALLSQLITQKALRRVDHYSRMAILAGWLALTDAGNDKKTTGTLSEPMGVIVATGWGPTARACDSRSSDSAGLHLSPIQFSNSVHNAAAAYLSMLLKMRGPNLSINQYDMSVPLAFQTAMDWLEEGRVTSVLVGGVDCCSTIRPDASGIPEDQQADIRHHSACGGSAFFVLGMSGNENSTYPCIHNARVERCQNDDLKSSDILFLHDGSREESDVIGPESPHANFSNIYGVFPSSMALDIAMAALLLKNNQSLIDLLPQVHPRPDFLKNPRIRCLKKGIAGDWGMIDMRRKPVFVSTEYAK